MIPYQLPTAMHVRLEVFNILGQRVATLVDGEQPAGFHTASWDATDEAGQAVGAGVYLYRLSSDGVQATRSMLLIDGQAWHSVEQFAFQRRQRQLEQHAHYQKRQCLDDREPALR